MSAVLFDKTGTLTTGVLRVSELAAWADAGVIARQITGAAIAATVAWAVRALDDTGLRASMVHAAASMALGVAKGGARTALELTSRDAADSYCPPVSHISSPLVQNPALSSAELDPSICRAVVL